MKSKFKRLVLTFLIIITLSFIPEVKAVTLSSSTCFYFNRTTGSYSSTKVNSNYGKDCVKALNGDANVNGKNAYCAEWGKNIKTKTYTQDSSWSTASPQAIISGIIISKVNNQYDGTKAYEMTAVTLNTYFRRGLNNASSYSYYDQNNEIKALYDAAINEYNTYKITTSLPAITTSKNQTFNYSNGTYISDKVTFSNLQKTYGGSSDTVTYTISADKGAKICSRASGIESSCSTSVTLTNRESYSFYVKATNVNPSEVVKVTVIGTNQSTYPSSYLYVGGNNTQKLVVETTVTYHRGTTSNILLTVPNMTNHTIQARKVDEHGALLSGAVLEIYQDTPYSGKKLASGTSESTITYTSPTVALSDDDFFNHDYYLVEKLAPNGYVLNSEINKFYIKSSSSSENSTICYYNGGNESDDSEIVDNERCNFANYENKCQGSDGSIKDLTENNDCIFETEEEKPSEEENTTKEEDTKTEDNNTESNEDSTEENTDEETKENEEEKEPEITYEKVCYKISTGKVIKDDSYCNNKSNYTKVETRNGNLVVTQPNEKNKLIISKKGITGDEEISGAKLKVCTKADYELTKEDCEAVSTIDNIKMEWTSGTTPKEYQGISKGDYYIVETIAPNGYIKASTATSFSVDATGKMVSDKKELEDNTIVIKNQLNSLSISKQDMTTSKELKGATLSICITYEDENNEIKIEKDQHTGDCIPAVLADGTKATWTSTDKPKKIEGLAAGAYYLVENIAPTNYSTAESILFIVSEDGTILDENGKAIADNKIIMKDKLINNPKTADLPIIAITIVGAIGLTTGIISYYKINKKNNKTTSKKEKKKISKK